MRLFRLLLFPICIVLCLLRAGAEAPPWKAQWIGPEASGNEQTANLWVCYRKSFELARKPKSAVARIAVDSHYWLWVNGKQEDSYQGPTADAKEKNAFYHKIGLYRDRLKQRMTMYFDRYAMGRDRASVEAAFHSKPTA